MLENPKKYFWTRAAFQIIAFSFLTVTLLMLINFDLKKSGTSCLAILASKHCCDMISNTVDMTALAKEKLSLMRWRIPFDLLSTILIISVQVKLSKLSESENLQSIEDEKVKVWVAMEIALFYIGLLV